MFFKSSHHTFSTISSPFPHLLIIHALTPLITLPPSPLPLSHALTHPLLPPCHQQAPVKYPHMLGSSQASSPLPLPLSHALTHPLLPPCHQQAPREIPPYVRILPGGRERHLFSGGVRGRVELFSRDGTKSSGGWNRGMGTQVTPLVIASQSHLLSDSQKKRISAHIT